MSRGGIAMRQNRVTAPWNGVDTVAAKPGRPRKNGVGTNGNPGCIWPEWEEGAACRKRVAHRLALCAEHAKVLSRGPGEACAWPGCLQPAPFRALCTYHDKRAHGLLDAGR